MQFKYKTQELIDKGIDFSVIFPEKQKAVTEMTGFSFDFPAIVAFLRTATDNFTKQNLVALDIDSEIYATYLVWESKKPVPKPEPIPEPEPKHKIGDVLMHEDLGKKYKVKILAITGWTGKEHRYDIEFVDENNNGTGKFATSYDEVLSIFKDERPSVAVLTSRLKIVKKMNEKNPSIVLKGRIKIIEKMLTQPEKFCCGGPTYAISDSVKMAGGGKFYKEGSDKWGLERTEIFIKQNGNKFDVYDNIFEAEKWGVKKLGEFDTMADAEEFAIGLTKMSTGGELKTELKRLNDELAQSERGTPERMDILGKINMLQHKHPELRKPNFAGGGKPAAKKSVQ